MLKALIDSKTIKAKCTWLDSFNRHLCDAYVGSKHVNKTMIQQGGAWLHVKYYDHQKDKMKLVNIEEFARNNGVGLWGISEYKTAKPWEF